MIDALSKVELFEPAWPVVDISASAFSYPFRYADDEWTDLGALTVPAYVDPAFRLAKWARCFVRGEPTDTLSLLKDVSNGIASAIAYQTRDNRRKVLSIRSTGGGVRAGISRSCLRKPRERLGSAHEWSLDISMIPASMGSRGPGSTHAWAEVFVPGAGWIAFDPTNRSVGAFNLLQVARVRDIRQASPVSGSYVGGSGLSRFVGRGLPSGGLTCADWRTGPGRLLPVIVHAQGSQSALRLDIENATTGQVFLGAGRLTRADPPGLPSNQIGRPRRQAFPRRFLNFNAPAEPGRRIAKSAGIFFLR